MCGQDRFWRSDRAGGAISIHGESVSLLNPLQPLREARPTRVHRQLECPEACCCFESDEQHAAAGDRIACIRLHNRNFYIDNQQIIG